MDLNGLHHPYDPSRAGTPERQCSGEATHGPHEWHVDGVLRRQCPGFVGRAGVAAHPVDPSEAGAGGAR